MLHLVHVVVLSGMGIWNVQISHILAIGCGRRFGLFV